MTVEEANSQHVAEYDRLIGAAEERLAHLAVLAMFCDDGPDWAMEYALDASSEIEELNRLRADALACLETGRPHVARME